MAYSTLGMAKALAECSLCLSAFDKPKCLPCIHTFCLNCLKEYVENEKSGELKCPLCRAEFTVPKNGVEGFPNNFFIQDIIKSQIQGLDDRNKISYKNCNKHTMQPLNRSCLQCDMAVCMECLITEHNGHRLGKGDEGTGRWDEQLSLKHNEIESVILSMPDLLRKGDALLKSILDVGTDQKKRITDRCDKLCELIHKHKNELINELSKGMEASANKVKSQMDEISSHKELMESHANMLQEMKTSDSSSDIAGKSKEFLKRADDLLGRGIQLKQRGIQEDSTYKHFIFHAYEGDVMLKKYIGCWNSQQGRILITLGLTVDDSKTEQKIFEISLDKPGTINVINSTPTEIKTESAACVVSNFLYAVGIGRAYKELWKWSASRDEWARCADMPSGRRKHCVTSVGDKIYVLGGWSDAEKKALDSILSYDIYSNDWTQVGKLRHAARSAACATYKHYAFVFGGVDKRSKVVDYVQIYDTVKGSVALGSNPMPEAYNLMRAVVWRTKALLIGRYTCFIYDFEFHTWQEREKFKTDLGHFGLTLDDNILYISGGGTGNNGVWICSDEVKSLLVDDFVLDNKKAEWKHHATLPTPGLINSYNTVTLLK